MLLESLLEKCCKCFRKEINFRTAALFADTYTHLMSIENEERKNYFIDDESLHSNYTTSIIIIMLFVSSRDEEKNKIKNSFMYSMSLTSTTFRRVILCCFARWVCARLWHFNLTRKFSENKTFLAPTLFFLCFVERTNERAKSSSDFPLKNNF